MNVFLGVLSTGKGTWGQVAHIIDNKDYEKVYLVSNEWAQDKFNCTKTINWIIIDPRKGFSEIMDDLEKQWPTDIQEIDAASNRGIDEIRKIKRNSGLIPFFKKYKVYIIDEAHALTSQASNAFLKTLEEPSSRTKFILCTTEPGKLLATIKSRCLPFYFVPIRFYDIKDKLEEITQKEGYNLKDSKILFKIAERSNNTLRDAINYLDLCLQNTEDKTLTLDIIENTLGLIQDDKIYELIDYLVGNRPQKFFTVISSLVSNGKKYEDIIVYLRGQVKEMIFVKKGLTKNISPYKLKIIKEKNYPIDKLFKILVILGKAINSIQGFVNPKDTSELAYLQIFLQK